MADADGKGIDEEALAKEEAAKAAAEFDEKAKAVREYYDMMFGQQLKDTLQALATERPADAVDALAKVCQGKKSIGEISKEPKTKDANLRGAAPRQYLHQSVASDLVPELMRCYREQSRRPVSDLGDLLAKRAAEKK
eukprot:TRINITY_DN6206_c0_g1_i1.p2 TRINITY_DN6206_c0_g1~~TRINITY_DN6206_c0_g1_i1.p2  ORF type:complete len:137 (+),score=58.49 TRINITY_DN6206_c0_g1_i1:142-552(+)